MKISGRKTGSAYEQYGFIPKVENGKHSAICMSCNRVLQNTAVVRLQKHRNSCLATRSFGGDQVNFSNIQIKQRIPIKSVAAQQNETINSAVKTERTEQNSMEYDGTNPNDDVNDSTTYEETLEATHSSRRLPKSAQNDEMNIYNISHKSLEYHDRLNNEENPIKTPISVVQQPPEPFETYSTNASLFRTPQLDIDGEHDEDIVNIDDELDVIQNLMPRSKESKQLQDELSKAEAEYYRCKAAYFAKLNENCKIKQTLMLLESRKLQLEIEKLSNQS